MPIPRVILAVLGLSVASRPARQDGELHLATYVADSTAFDVTSTLI